MDGLLPARATQQVASHLAACEACARYDRMLRRSLELVHEMPELPLSDEFEQRLQHRLFHLQDGAALAQERPVAGVGVAAAVAVMIALVAWSPLLLSSRDVAPSSTLSLHATQNVTRADVELTTSPAQSMSVSAEPLDVMIDGWFNAPLSAPAASVHSLAFPGPYSPLIVQPPVHGGAVRTISTEYRAFE
jgi:anti-sigma factor RsiW